LDIWIEAEPLTTTWSAEEFLTPQEVAARWRVSAYIVRRWIETGALEAETMKEGKRNRHRIRNLLLEALETASAPAMTKHPLLATSRIVVLLCLLICAMGYFSSGFLGDLGLFEAGVGICAFCDALFTLIRNPLVLKSVAKIYKAASRAP